MNDTEILEMAKKYGFDGLTKEESYGTVVTEFGIKFLTFVYHLLEKGK